MTRIPMIRHKFDEGIEVYPISDLHIGSKEFNEGQFQRVSREILEQPNRYCVIAGDIVDNGIKSSVTSGYDAVMQPAAQRKYAAEILYPLRDRILCFVSGNHEARSARESDTDVAELIASKLDLEHLFKPDIAFLDISCGKRPHHGVRPPRYCVAVTHGAGGGMLLGSGINKAEPFAQAIGCDLLITGHTHRPITAPSARLVPDLGKGIMILREIRLLTGTAYMDYGGYPSRKMMRPVTIRQNKAILSDNSFDIAVLS